MACQPGCGALLASFCRKTVLLSGSTAPLRSRLSKSSRISVALLRRARQQAVLDGLKRVSRQKLARAGHALLGGGSSDPPGPAGGLAQASSCNAT
jgi:hypothetical protein